MKKKGKRQKRRLLKQKKKANKEKTEASLLTTVTAGIAYGVGKDKIIERLCKEFKLTKNAAEKKYKKYAVETA